MIFCFSATSEGVRFRRQGESGESPSRRQRHLTRERALNGDVVRDVRTPSPLTVDTSDAEIVHDSSYG